LDATWMKKILRMSWPPMSSQWWVTIVCNSWMQHEWKTSMSKLGTTVETRVLPFPTMPQISIKNPREAHVDSQPARDLHNSKIHSQLSWYGTCYRIHSHQTCVAFLRMMLNMCLNMCSMLFLSPNCPHEQIG
jgi:hypothetical protein